MAHDHQRIAYLLAGATLLMAISAGADGGDTTDALPGVVHVPIASTAPRGLGVAASGGYGYTESVLGKGDAYSRASGSLAVSYQPASYFAAALRLDGRYDVDTGAPAAHGLTGDPRLELRAVGPVLDTFQVAAQVGIWAPGGVAPSFPVRAITPDASVIGTLSPHESPWVFTSRLGFRWDNSAESVSNVDKIPLPDRVELGISRANAVLTGLAATYRVNPNLDLLGDLTWDLLVGSAAPRAIDAPILASAGVRSTLDADGKLQILGALTVSPSGRPTITATSPLVDIEPRVSVLVALVLRPFAKRAVAPAVVLPAPTPEAAPARPARTRLKGRAVAEDGVTPLAHAEVTLTPAKGGEKQQTRTDEDGRFESGDLEPGDVTVDISAPGFTPIKKTLTISDTSPPIDIVVPHTLPAGEVRGIVLDVAGKPIMATVRIDPGGADVPLGPDGRFRTDVQPGSYDVIIRAPGYADQKRHITVERDGVVLVDILLRKEAR